MKKSYFKTFWKGAHQEEEEEEKIKKDLEIRKCKK